jgi:putative ABC transport system ATP-binding protein
MLRLEDIRKTFHAGANKKSAHGHRPGPRGDFVVIGSNGAGRARLNVVGRHRPTGRVLIDGPDVAACPHGRSRVARVFQDTRPAAPGLTRRTRHRLAQKHRTCVAARFESASVCGARRSVGLEDRLQTRVDLLSGGQRQAVSLVMALCGDPKLLILDEHCAALDPRTAETVMGATVGAVERTGITTLMITHNMHHAIAFGYRLVMLHEGRVLFEASGEEKALLTVEGLVKRFGIVDDELLLAG